MQGRSRTAREAFECPLQSPLPFAKFKPKTTFDWRKWREGSEVFSVGSIRQEFTLFGRFGV